VCVCSAVFYQQRYQQCILGLCRLEWLENGELAIMCREAVVPIWDVHGICLGNGGGGGGGELSAEFQTGRLHSNVIRYWTVLFYCISAYNAGWTLLCESIIWASGNECNFRPSCNVFFDTHTHTHTHIWPLHTVCECWCKYFWTRRPETRTSFMHVIYTTKGIPETVLSEEPGGRRWIGFEYA
jgi:hypothetical protein